MALFCFGEIYFMKQTKHITLSSSATGVCSDRLMYSTVDLELLNCFVKLLFQRSRFCQNTMKWHHCLYFSLKNFYTLLRWALYVCLSPQNQVLTVTSQPAKFIQMATHVCIQQHRSQLLGSLTGLSRVQPPCLCWQLLLLRTPAVHSFPLSYWLV